MKHWFSVISEKIAIAAAHPIAFVVATALVLIWAASGPMTGYSEPWMLVINTVTTIVTFLLGFLILAAGRRDSLALHAKMNELVRAIETADDRFIGIEKKDVDVIEKDCP